MATEAHPRTWLPPWVTWWATTAGRPLPAHAVRRVGPGDAARPPERVHGRPGGGAAHRAPRRAPARDAARARRPGRGGQGPRRRTPVGVLRLPRRRGCRRGRPAGIVPPEP